MSERSNSVQLNLENVPTNGLAQAAHIRQGDRCAFKRLFCVYYEPLCRFAYGYVDTVEVAEDLVQDVFLDIWNRRCSWYPERSVKAYLYGAVRNQALKHLRQVRARRRMEEQQKGCPQPVPQTPAMMLHFRNMEEAVAQAIQELPERRRHIFILSRHHDLTYKEIAVLLDISVKTVETQVGRALRFLRKRLGSHRVDST